MRCQIKNYIYCVICFLLYLLNSDFVYSKDSNLKELTALQKEVLHSRVLDIKCSNDICIMLMEYGILFRKEGKNSWKKIRKSQEKQLWKLDFSENNGKLFWYLSNDQEIYLSVDSGTTWIQKLNTKNYIIDASVNKDNGLYIAVTDEEVFQFNGVDLTNQVQFETSQFLKIHQIQINNSIFFVLQNETNLFLSSDGVSWIKGIKVIENEGIKSIVSINSNVYLMNTYRGAYYTNDILNGTWSVVDLDFNMTSYDLYLSEFNSTAYLVNGSKREIFSTRNGSTWSLEESFSKELKLHGHVEINELHILNSTGLIGSIFSKNYGLNSTELLGLKTMDLNSIATSHNNRVSRATSAYGFYEFNDLDFSSIPKFTPYIELHPEVKKFYENFNYSRVIPSIVYGDTDVKWVINFNTYYLWVDEEGVWHSSDISRSSFSKIIYSRKFDSWIKLTDGKILKSIDLREWEQVSNSDIFYHIAESKSGSYFLGSSRNGIQYSEDLRLWKTLPINQNIVFFRELYVEDRWVFNVTRRGSFVAEITDKGLLKILNYNLSNRQNWLINYLIELKDNYFINLTEDEIEFYINGKLINILKHVYAGFVGFDVLTNDEDIIISSGPNIIKFSNNTKMPIFVTEPEFDFKGKKVQLNINQNNSSCYKFKLEINGSIVNPYNLAKISTIEDIEFEKGDKNLIVEFDPNEKIDLYPGQSGYFQIQLICPDFTTYYPSSAKSIKLKYNKPSISTNTLITIIVSLSVLLSILLVIAIFYIYSPFKLISIWQMLKPEKMGFKVGINPIDLLINAIKLGILPSYAYLPYLVRSERVLQSAVNNKIENWKKNDFDELATVKISPNYIPLSCEIYYDSNMVPVKEPSKLILNDLLSMNKRFIIVSGYGGTGKTMLAIQFAEWLMDGSEGKYKTRIPVLIDEDFTSNIQSELLEHIHRRINASENSSLNKSQLPKDYIKVMLEYGYVIPIFDRLSEKSVETIDSFQNQLVGGELKVATIIVTSRTKLTPLGGQVIDIVPDKIKSTSMISFFVEKLFESKGLKVEFEETNKLVEKIILLNKSNLGLSKDEFITPLLIKLIVDQYVEKRAIGKLSDKIEDVYYEYLKELCGKEWYVKYISYLKTLASNSISINYQLKDIEITAAEKQVKIIDNSFDFEKFIQRMLSSNILKKYSNPNLASDFISFSYDPVAEFLAAAFKVEMFKKENCTDLEFNKYLSEIENSSQKLIGYIGFLKSIWNS